MTTKTAPKIVPGTVTLRGCKLDGTIQENIVPAMLYAGLAAHRPWDNQDGKTYRITHVASGKAFAHMPGQRAARKALLALATFTDWTQPEEAVRAVVQGPAFGKLREVIRECGGF